MGAVRDGRALTLTLVGELDMESADEVRRVTGGLLEGVSAVEVDCSSLVFIDSIGISSLAHLVTLAAREGVEVRFNFSERVLRVLETSGLIERLRSPLAAAGRPANAV